MSTNLLLFFIYLQGSLCFSKIVGIGAVKFNEWC